jgi:hypothetical protein
MLEDSIPNLGGACLDRADLPWIADPEQSTPWERLAMGRRARTAQCRATARAT